MDSCFSGPKPHCGLVLVDFAFVYKNLYLQYPRNYRQNLILMMTRKISIDFGNVFTKVVQGGLFYSSTKADFNSLREKFFLRNEHGVGRALEDEIFEDGYLRT